jgi:hypothetical protein
LTDPVHLTRAAEADIAQAFDWYEAKTENLGFEFIEQVERAIERISAHPLSHRKIVDDVKRANLDRLAWSVVQNRSGWQHCDRLPPSQEESATGECARRQEPKGPRFG